ncbi:MAG: hypothetical protein WAO06_05950 [Tenuifilaceae bacterium]
MEYAFHQAFHVHTCSAAVAPPSVYCCRLSLLRYARLRPEHQFNGVAKIGEFGQKNNPISRDGV